MVMRARRRGYPDAMAYKDPKAITAAGIETGV
jgi:hypothetical protein